MESLSRPSPPSVQVPKPKTRRWQKHRRATIDVVVLILTLTYNQLVISTSASSTASQWQMTGLSIALGVCWTIRHRHPWGAFSAMIPLSWMQLLANPTTSALPVNIVLAFMVYHIATITQKITSLLATSLIIAWIPFSFAPAIRIGHSTIALPLLAVTIVMWAWAAGNLRRSRANHIASLAHQAKVQLIEAKRRHNEIEQETLSNIAREIHDIVSHSLSAMIVVADGAAAIAPSDPNRAAAAMRRVRDTGREAVDDIHRMLSALRNDESANNSPMPTIDDLEPLVQEARDAGMPVHMDAPKNLNLSPGISLTVYRIVQEALTNVRRHAGPVSEVNVHVYLFSSDLVVEVVDDGHCTSPPHPSRSMTRRYGLVGMRERITSHGGTLETDQTSQGGFRLRATIPLNDKESS